MNTRTKDLIDMVLLVREQKLEKGKVLAAIEATFERRATHELPADLEPPPREWEPVFDALAKECHLAMSASGGFEFVREFVRTLEA